MYIDEAHTALDIFRFVAFFEGTPKFAWLSPIKLLWPIFFKVHRQNNAGTICNSGIGMLFYSFFFCFLRAALE